LAAKITAIHTYRPELERVRTMQNQELVEVIAQRTSLSEGEIHHVVYSLRDVLLTAHRAGQAVKVEGLGTFTPTIRKGRLDIDFRPDVSLLEQLNDMARIYTNILNKENLGKSADELVELWNLEHPDDLVEG
jgi:predicted histone-like DNA-binding protein